MAKERRQPDLNFTINSISSMAAITTALLLLWPQQLQASADANSTTRRGLSLSVVHRDSIHSSSYPGPLTDLQRLLRTIRFSRFPVANASSSVIPLDDGCGIGPPVTFGSVYVITFAMGTPSRIFKLELDTGSDVTWTQCVPSDPQFRQAHPLFDPSSSSSFRYLYPERDRCETPSYAEGPYCKYELLYGSGERTSGLLGVDTFHFFSPGAAGGMMSFPGLTFGCSHASGGGVFAQTQDGVLGMGKGPLSFAMQVGMYFDGRFSYCLFDPRDESGLSRLLFGDYIQMDGDVQTTPFLEVESSTNYYLTLEDITLSGLSLGLNAEVYEPGDLLQRGTIIDSGSVGFLYDPVFDALKDIMTAYFALFDYTPFDMGTLSSTPLEVCYDDTDKPFSLREDIFLTYRFQGPALLDVPSKHFFADLFDSGSPPFFCLNVYRHSLLTLIGHWQQRDVRFTYDLIEEVLHFVPESCDISSPGD